MLCAYRDTPAWRGEIPPLEGQRLKVKWLIERTCHELVLPKFVRLIFFFLKMGSGSCSIT